MLLLLGREGQGIESQSDRCIERGGLGSSLPLLHLSQLSGPPAGAVLPAVCRHVSPCALSYTHTCTHSRCAMFSLCSLTHTHTYTITRTYPPAPPRTAHPQASLPDRTPGPRLRRLLPRAPGRSGRPLAGAPGVYQYVYGCACGRACGCLRARIRAMCMLVLGCWCSIPPGVLNA